jgi:outer membrane protein assembly factor BamB
MGLLTTRRIGFFLLTFAFAGCGGLRLDHVPRERAGDWPTFARTGNRSAVAQRGLRPPLALEWETDVSAGIGNGSPVIVDSIVFVGNLRGELCAYAATTGKRLGWISLGDAIQGSPVVDGTIAFVAMSNSRESVAAFDLVTGRPRWKKSYGDIEVSPLLYQEHIYVGNTAGSFFCLDRGNGDQRWRFDIPGNARLKGIRSSPAADSGTVVFGADDGSVYGLNAETGALRWKTDTGAPVSASPLIDNGKVFIGNRAGTVFAISQSTGTLAWRANAGAGVFGNAVPAGTLVIFGTSSGNVLAYQRADGARVWSADAGGPVNAGGAVAGFVMYVGTLRKEVVALSVTDGTVLWKADAGGRIRTSPAVVDGRVVIATDERVLRAYKETNP